MQDLDSAIEALDAAEARQRAGGQRLQNRTLIGTVEKFFDKIGVVAVTLTDSLKVGDVIEIESEEYTVRQSVKSMQINRKDIVEAKSGDDVGIKLSVPVPEGSRVYRLG